MRWLAKLPQRQRTVVECGAGHAELCRFFSGHFNLAIAIDTNPPPGAYPALRTEPISYIKGCATNLPLPSGSVDLIVSMQALHHFDVARHLVEAHRVLSTGGIFAALSWGAIELPQHIREACDDFLMLAERYWEAERDWVVSGYPGLEFVGECVNLPPAAMCKTLSVGDLSRTFQSWSAYKLGTRNCPEAFDAALEKLHKLGETKVNAAWPIKGRIFRKRQDPPEQSGL
ncbi:hypothetical protein RA2_01227 [Roseovarius sp. A-2]|uniref:class I SAM-dependent methyltransferase n=1 Tax=Roseovarius sp. A-2 TaxID=1570360 RepID=UPI0009B55AF1|nr:class I SAM-dependent methyltransferase [Roseovarius sp. A-2]GAW34182.1 hypothetical protein RA2_01227 [Roseovarius sp. A-2]